MFTLEIWQNGNCISYLPHQNAEVQPNDVLVVCGEEYTVKSVQRRFENDHLLIKAFV